MNPKTLQSLGILSIAEIMLLLGLLTSGTFAHAKPTPDAIAKSSQNNPLDLTKPDPLLPDPPKDGFLESPEREALAEALDELNLEAAAQLEAGNTQAAFQIWNRELRLRRYLGPMEELVALRRVGSTAWRQEEITQLQIITRRLETLEVEYCSAEESCELEFLTELAQGYEAVQARENAIDAYKTILAEAQTREDIETSTTLLNTIARFSLEALDYVEAAWAYERLLAIADTQENQAEAIAHVQELTYIYSQGRQPEKAIAMRQRLVEFYSNAEDLRLVPALKLAIGLDYETLDRSDLALKNYQESYNLAWTLQQFYLAREALVKLAGIYQQIPQLDQALQVYEALLIVDRRSSNLYGLMTTYLKLGQLHKTRENYPQAIAAFQKGLELSEQLNSTEYKSSFQTNIEELR